MSPLPRKYEDTVAEEMRLYTDRLDVHNLPPIFHHWSETHLLPALTPFGLSGANDLFVQSLARQFGHSSGRMLRFASLGSGNCDLEIAVARELAGRGLRNFVFDCVDLNPAMLARGRSAAVRAGVEALMGFEEGDLNSWRPARDYDGIIANQSLHHVVKLEELFAEVKRAIGPQGCFAISDMIGRNGHQRWPEALQIVHELWRELPPSYRLNRTSGCYEEMFFDHDCSVEGFEGVRSEDILPLLVDRFAFWFFFPFGNLIDPFIDRSFGPNFDPEVEWDRAFIGRVHARDLAEMECGYLKPTHMFAVVGNATPEVSIYPGHLSPQFSVRPPMVCPKLRPVESSPTYQWSEWQDRTEKELQNACRMLTNATQIVRQRTDWAHELERESAARLEWGCDAERQLAAVSDWAHGLERDVAMLTVWARGLEQELAERTEWAGILQAETLHLKAELDARTAWAQQLDHELAEKVLWAETLDRRLKEQTVQTAAAKQQFELYLRHPVNRFLRTLAALLRRVTGGR